MLNMREGGDIYCIHSLLHSVLHKASMRKGFCLQCNYDSRAMWINRYWLSETFLFLMLRGRRTEVIAYILRDSTLRVEISHGTWERKHKTGRELSVQLFIWNLRSTFIDGAFGIPPTGRDRKATRKQSKLPWDSSSSHFAVLLYTSETLQGTQRGG